MDSYQRALLLTQGWVNNRWDESFLARRRPPTRRAIPRPLIAGRVVDKGSWYHTVLFRNPISGL
jgi:hypothetical protein